MQYQKPKEHLKLNLAILEKGGERFEVIIDCDKAVAFKEGANVDITDILVSQDVFSDSQSGSHASENRMKDIFGTKDTLEVAKVIIKEGHIQLTQEHREKIRQQKEKQIVAEIARKAIDPTTKLPHPPERIRLAMAQAKVHISEFQTVSHQMPDIIKKLKPIIPISFEAVMYRITVAATDIGKVQQPVRKHGEIVSEEYGAQGEWIFTTKVEGADGPELIAALQSLTHGKVEIQRI